MFLESLMRERLGLNEHQIKCLTLLEIVPMLLLFSFVISPFPANINCHVF